MDPEVRRKIREDVEREIPGWTNPIKTFGLEYAILACENRELIGLTIIDLARSRGEDELTTFFDLIIEYSLDKRRSCVRRGKPTGALAGKVLRHSAA